MCCNGKSPMLEEYIRNNPDRLEKLADYGKGLVEGMEAHDTGRLPQSFMDKYLAKGLEATIFGIPISRLTFHEAVAVIGHLSNELERQRRF